jgi:hypothetical protein
MARNPSSTMASPMRRSISRCSTTNDLQRSGSNASSWQSSFEEQSGYSLCSDPASMHRQPSLQPIAETSFVGDGMVEYSPDEYINTYMSTNGSSPLPIPQSQNPRQLHVQLTPNAQWSPSLDNSTSPSTPSTALMTPVTQSSNLSRQGSYNPQYFEPTHMLRIQSDSSSMFPVLSEDGSFSFPSYDVESKSISTFADTPHFLSTFTGSTSEAFFSTVPVSPASASALASSEHDTSDLAEDMRRSTSSSAESDSSSASAASIASRHARREREINAQATRCKIAPKADLSNNATKSASSNDQMMRIRSDDGSCKDVGMIPKAPYIRPQHPKIRCPHCNERPNGFRGTHELERHVSRAHTARRKGFICIDASADKKFLAGCKHCRNKKVYGAYYNAAAHLRRAHFHPRKRGRKGKGDEKRGGIGGGDDPPMDYLKQHWIQDIEVENKTTQSADAGSDSAEAADVNDFDATYDMDTSYPSTVQQPNDAFMPIDSNQFVDYSMCMNYTTNEPYSAASDINDFQFDACRTF